MAVVFKILTGMRHFGVCARILIFCGLILVSGPLVWAGPTSGDKIDEYRRATDWLTAPTRTQSEIRSFSAELAEKYLTDQRIQEAIWVLRFGGHLERAKSLEQSLVKLLSESKTELIEKFQTGKEGATLHRIVGTEVYVVEKNRSPYQGGTEVTASILDQILGLDIVPITVESVNADGKTISRQYFMRDSLTASAIEMEKIGPELEVLQKDRNHNAAFDLQNKAKWVNLASRGYPEELKKMWLLDYILDNGDRHGKNWLRLFGTQNGKAISIDHGLCLGGCAGSDWKRKEYGPIYSDIAFNENNLPSLRVAKVLESLTRERLRSLFSGLISETQIEGIFLRKEKVVSATRSRYSKVKCSGLFLSK